MRIKEIWKDVVGYEGRYKVSNLGNVKGTVICSRYRNIRLLVPQINGAGYPCIMLYKNRKPLSQRVHRLFDNALRLDDLYKRKN